MSSPSEPEKYSIDDMMERLKNRPAEDPIEYGQLVTRPDGSQAVRVRKRKRRSHQPVKEERARQRRARMFQISGFLILLFAGLIAAGVALAYANTPTFREGLVRKISASSGARVDLQRFRVNPTYAVADWLSLDWPGGNALQNLSLRGIKANLHPVSFLGRSVRGEEMLVQEATLNLREPQGGVPLWEGPAASGTDTAVRFDQYTIPKLNVIFGDRATSPVQIWGSEATFVSANRNGRPELLLNKGDLAASGWPKLRIHRAYIDFSGKQVNLVSLRLMHETDSTGIFELSGTIFPYPPGRASELSVLLDDYPVSGIAGPEFGLLFAGRIDTQPATGSNRLTFTPGHDAAASLSVTFSCPGKSLELSGFPMLSGLSQALDDEWFLRPDFDTEAGGLLRRADGSVEIENLKLESKDRMALRGGVTMNPARQLSGDLEVGLAEGMIKASGSRRLDAMFSPPREGYRWLTVRIGGSAGSPADNFKELYESSTSAPPATPERGVPSFDDLTRPK
jgi:hypothetical protein